MRARLRHLRHLPARNDVLQRGLRLWSGLSRALDGTADLTGAVLTETVFSWPGLGREIYEAILARDTPVIMGAFILMSFTVAIASLVTDLLYAALDPRVKL